MYDKVPRRIKRLIFIASILGLIDSDKEISMSLAARVNHILRIAHYDEALHFPIAIKSIIWKSLVRNPVVDIAGKLYNLHNPRELLKADADLTATADLLISKAPLWLIYGSKNLMHADIKTLFQKVIAD